MTTESQGREGRLSPQPKEKFPPAVPQDRAFSTSSRSSRFCYSSYCLTVLLVTKYCYFYQCEVLVLLATTTPFIQGIP
eukprot:g76215.t1